MKLYSIFLIVLFAVYSLASATDHDNRGCYYAELQRLKDSPETKQIFDENACKGWMNIEHDPRIRKELTLLQRLIRWRFLWDDVILVTPETMPRLYGYVAKECEKARIEIPTIFITRHEGFLNAFAHKLLMSNGAIVIGQLLMQEISDEALEGVIAHELGHIKHNHANKTLALYLLVEIGCVGFMSKFEKYIAVKSDNAGAYALKYGVLGGASFLISLLATSLIINKRFEKEADAFAYETNGRAKGLIEFFELILQLYEIEEEEFASRYELLHKNKFSLSISGYYGSLCRFYCAKSSYLFNRAYREIYAHTFLGAHPSPQARIKAAQDYLAQQNA